MENLRNEFGVFKKKIYLNYASISPFSNIHLKSFLKSIKYQLMFNEDLDKNMEVLKEDLREKIAKFINAESKETIALTYNTSYGISSFASSIGLKKGDRILIYGSDFPANVYPFLHLKSKGVEVDFIKTKNFYFELKDLKNSIKKNTKLLSLSFVHFLSGYRAYLKEIGEFLKERDILFFVDGIQGVGACPINVKEEKIDGLSCGGAKWLMWPMGTGFLYLKPEILKNLSPPIVGWQSFKNCWDFLNYKYDFFEDARKFELGTINFNGFFCANDMLSIFLKAGIEKIFKKIIELRKIFLKEIKKLKIKTITPEDGESGIVSIEHRDFEKLYRHLIEKNVIISKRLNYLRFSFHFINNEEDIIKTVFLIKKFLKSGA